MSMMTLYANVCQKNATLIETWLSPLFALYIRFIIAQAFFMSGLTKIKSWSSTLDLFRYEYSVPLLSPEIAAYLATTAELTLPVLFLLGILSRPVALVLFLFNIVAAISYPDISPAGVIQHQMWGMMILVIFFYGAGKLALEDFLIKKYVK